MQEKVTKDSGCLTYLFLRMSIKVSPNGRETPQIHLYSTSNKTVLHGLALKRENTICKMAVCKMNGYSLQDDSLQDIDMCTDIKATYIP